MFSEGKGEMAAVKYFLLKYNLIPNNNSNKNSGSYSFDRGDNEQTMKALKNTETLLKAYTFSQN